MKFTKHSNASKAMMTRYYCLNLADHAVILRWHFLQRRYT